MDGKRDIEFDDRKKKIRKQTKAAKEKWQREKCEEVEQLLNKYDIFNAHKKKKVNE